MSVCDVNENGNPFSNIGRTLWYKISVVSSRYFVPNTIQLTTHADWSKMEIVRGMKEDFLSVSDEFLQQKLSDQARIAQYELPDGS